MSLRTIAAPHLSPSAKRFLSLLAIVFLLIANILVSTRVFAHNYPSYEHWNRYGSTVKLYL